MVRGVLALLHAGHKQDIIANISGYTVILAKCDGGYKVVPHPV